MTETLTQSKRMDRGSAEHLPNGAIRVRRALLSAYDKSGLLPLAQTLRQLGVEIVSTGGTFSMLRDGGVPARAVEEVTGYGAMLGGRLKTLHPKLLGGILARRDNTSDTHDLSEAQIDPIDLVVVNLYPFETVADDPSATRDDAIELIDVGGPTMIRAAAKNHAWVAVVCDPADYESLSRELQATDGCVSEDSRTRLASKAFSITAAYDTRIADYFARNVGQDASPGFPSIWLQRYDYVAGLRYGENPHQRAAVYGAADSTQSSLARARVIGGREISYNNYNDLDAAWRMAADFSEPFAAVFKHATPCGAAEGNSIAAAYRSAHETDPLSAYGSIIALNRRVDYACAELLHATEFIECVLAPGYDEDALELLIRKKARRFVDVPTIDIESSAMRVREIIGGLLVQEDDRTNLTPADLRVVTRRSPTAEQITSLLFARKVVKHARSNAIAIASGCVAVGIGAGQTSRVDAVHQAVAKANNRTQGAVLASDAFFPMADGVEAAAAAGVAAIIQPGGSRRDAEVIAACDNANIAMVFSGLRNFRH